MADKNKSSAVKPMRMNLFATWEVEKSTPNCIPRLCSLTLTRLVVTKPLETDLQSIVIAVKMQNSKGTLRSIDIPLSTNGLLDTELDLTFAMQYPHFLKHNANNLQVMIQRRKKYKNRTILGFKTLAVGQINMTQVLQQSLDLELQLYSEDVCGKDGATVNNTLIGKVVMLSLTSQPVDHDDRHISHKVSSDADRSPDVDLSEDDDPEYSTNDSDSEPLGELGDRHVRNRKFKKTRPDVVNRQRNIKQKFIAMLRRFRMSEEVLDSEQEPDESIDQAGPHAKELEELFDELENLSESDTEIDTISVRSTPKPKLRPFFTGSGTVNSEIGDILQDNGNYEAELSMSNLPSHTFTTSSHQSSPDIEKAKHKITDEKVKNASNMSNVSPVVQRSTSILPKPVSKDGHVEADVQPATALISQLEKIFASDEMLPENLVLINNSDWQGKLLLQMLKDEKCVISTKSSAEVKATVSWIVNKLQKFCNTNSHSPNGLKIAVAGSDSYLHSVLWPYVEQFSSKSPDWQSYLHFLFIPIEMSSVAMCLSMLDSRYSSFFNDQLWKDVFEKSEDSMMHPDLNEIEQRIKTYIKSASNVIQVPIAEAMLTCKEKSTEEESSQIFVPFINEVYVGIKDGNKTHVSDVDDFPMQANLSSSPPSHHQFPHDRHDSHTPPNSPCVNPPAVMLGQSTSVGSASQSAEILDLQLDYWCLLNKPIDLSEKSDKPQKKDSKASLKTTFRLVQICRLPHATHTADNSSLTMNVVIKEKKQKILRMAKKSKDVDTKSQRIEGINRVICTTSKSQSHPLTVVIDSVEWHNVKFFQISSQWQTHVKNFPLVLFEFDEASL